MFSPSFLPSHFWEHDLFAVVKPGYPAWYGRGDHAARDFPPPEGDNVAQQENVRRVYPILKPATWRGEVGYSAAMNIDLDTEHINLPKFKAAYEEIVKLDSPSYWKEERP